MLDVFKDGAEAWLQRIRSPLIGSIVLAFVAFNWKAIFFVVFSDQAILTRFAFFDAQTSIQTLVYFPIGFGFLLGVLTPFVNYLGSLIAKWPTEKLRLLQVQSAHNVLSKKAEYVIAREIKSAEFKEAALRGAEATEAIMEANIDDEEKKRILLEALNSLPVSSEPFPTHSSSNDMADKVDKIRQSDLPIDEVVEALGVKGIAQDLLEAASKASDGIAYLKDLHVLHSLPRSGTTTALSFPNHRTRLEANKTLKKLSEFGLVKSISAERFEIVPRGYEYLEKVAGN